MCAVAKLRGYPNLPVTSKIWPHHSKSEQLRVDQFYFDLGILHFSASPGHFVLQ